MPVDVMIHDLSCGGCRVSDDRGLAEGDRVTIGLPGIGACPAKVVWSKNGEIGLEFRQALTGHDVDIARETNTLIDGHFGLTIQTPEPMDDDDEVVSLSARTRLGVIVATAVGAWVIAALAIWIVLHLV